MEFSRKKLGKDTGIYFVILVVAVVLICASYALAKVELYDPGEEAGKTKIQPEQIVQVDERTKEYFFTEKKIDETNATLMFYANHRFVQVYADGRKIYARESAHSIFGDTTGAVYYFIELPQGTKEVRVTMEAAYSQVEDEEIEFYQGNGVLMYEELLQDAIFPMIVSGIIVLLGIIMLCYWFIIGRKMKDGEALAYLGLFAYLIGTWSLGETNIVMLLVKNHVAVSFSAFVMLMLLVVPFVMFIYYFMQPRDKWFHRILTALACASIVVQLVLHFSGIAELKQLAGITHVMLGAALVYFLYAIIVRYRREGFSRKIKVGAVGFLVLVLAMLGDVITYYMGTPIGDAFGRIGFMCYIALLGYEVSANSLEVIEEGRKAEIYKELATKDLLTGTYNRNAYHNDTYGRMNLKDLLIITFDLNELKFCNDTFGHAAGDKYITDAADLILRVFGKYGKVYRIGGDEFCVLVDNGKGCRMEELLAQMQREQEDYNQESQNIKMVLACGYACFDPLSDEDLEDTRNRADAMMYENKKKSKKIV